MAEPAENEMETLEDEFVTTTPEEIVLTSDGAGNHTLDVVRLVALVAIGFGLMADATGVQQWLFAAAQDGSAFSNWEQFLQSLCYVVAIAGAIVFAAEVIDLGRGRRL
jgi:hypothetical protein